MSILTFGEIMLRLTPAHSGDKLSGSASFAVNYAGSESNVASSLAVLGNPVQFVTKVPDNPLGEGAIKSLSWYGIDTQRIKRGGDRLGTYFIELGASIRPSRVVYDRKYSAFSEIASDEFDWTEILPGTSWLFVSGITPAVSANCAAAAIALVKAAKKLNVKVAFDFNYRRTLWKDAADARKIFDEILANTDLLLGNAGSLQDVYHIDIAGSNEQELAERGVHLAAEQFGLKQVAFTIREHSSASQNKLGAVYLNEGNFIRSANYTVDIADRFGSGDAFAAGMLHGLTNGWDNQRTVGFAAAAFALKHTINGDQHTSLEHEIISVMEGNTSGHVIR
jgi:2-dehydro-3-deoxygluconokinase